MDAGKFMIDWFIPIWMMITLIEVSILMVKLLLSDSFKK